MQKNRWTFLIVTGAMIFAQGCSGSKDTAGGAGTSVVQAAVAASPAQSAVNLSDLAFKNEALALNQGRELDAALAADQGCGLASAYNGIGTGKDLLTSVAAYCTVLASQNVEVRNCSRAQSTAFQLAKEVRSLAKACSSEQSPDRRRLDTAALARTIIADGSTYRRELGLPAAERLR